MRMRKLAAGFALAAGLVFGACDAQDGAQGPAGDPGATGAQGPIGDKGLTGDTGAKGETGDAGVAGLKGPSGDKGPTGDQGATGDTGAAGQDGLCDGAEAITVTGTTDLPDYLLTGVESPEFTIDVENASGEPVDGLAFTWLTDGPELVEGSASNAFTVATDEPGTYTYRFWVTDGCTIADGTLTLVVEDFAARVALVHVSEVAGTVGVALKGTTTRLATLDYLDATAHLAVNSSTVQFDVLGPADAVLLTSPVLTLAHRQFVTVVAYDNAQGVPTLTVLDDSSEALADPDTTWGARAFHAVSGVGPVDVRDESGAGAVLFNDLALGALSVEAPVLPVGDQVFGLDVGGDGTSEYAFAFSVDGAADPVVAGEIATVFVVASEPFPQLLVRSVRPGSGTTFAALVPVDPSSLTYDVVVGEGSLAPSAPQALGLTIDGTTDTYTRTLTVAGCATVGYLTVGVDIPHEYRNDLQIELTAPGGTKVVLNASKFSAGLDFVGTFVDGGSNSGGTFNPTQPLAGFAGVVGNGTWSLYVKDKFASSDDGTFNGWSLNLICGE